MLRFKKTARTLVEHINLSFKFNVKRMMIEMRKDDISGKFVLIRILAIEVKLDQVPDNKLSNIRETLFTSDAGIGIRLMDYLAICEPHKVIPVYKRKPLANEKISRQLSNLLMLQKCQGDFCTFDYDKFEKHYDPIKKPFGMKLIAMMDNFRKTKMSANFNEISVNVINSVRLNAEEVINVLAENYLLPRVDPNSKANDRFVKDRTKLKSFMEKPLEHGTPYSIRKICHNCFVVYKVIEKELKSRVGGEVEIKHSEALTRNEQIFYGEYSLFKGHPYFYKAMNTKKPSVARLNKALPKQENLHKDTVQTIGRSVSAMAPQTLTELPRPASSSKFKITTNKESIKARRNELLATSNALVNSRGAIFLTNDNDLANVDFFEFKKILRMTNSDMNRRFRTNFLKTIGADEESLKLEKKDKAPKVGRNHLMDSSNRMYLGYSTARAEQLFDIDVYSGEKYKTKKNKDRIQTEEEIFSDTERSLDDIPLGLDILSRVDQGNCNII